MGRLAGDLEGLEAKGGGEAEGRWIVAGGRGGTLSPRADSMAEVESSRSWQSAELAYKLLLQQLALAAQHPRGAASSYLRNKCVVKCADAIALNNAEGKGPVPGVRFGVQN